jgi:steroid delta-isomerase
LRTGLAFGSVPTTAQLRETVAHYASVISARDADAYAAQFTVDAVQVDPYPTPPNVGRDAIRAFIQRSYDACEAMRFEVESIHPVADKAAIEFHITVTLAGGGTMHIRGTEIFTVTDEALISRVDAYWGDDDVVFQEALG